MSSMSRIKLVALMWCGHRVICATLASDPLHRSMKAFALSALSRYISHSSVAWNLRRGDSPPEGLADGGQLLVGVDPDALPYGLARENVLGGRSSGSRLLWECGNPYSGRGAYSD